MDSAEGEALTVVAQVPGAEVVGFIHINPDAMNWYFAIEVSDLLFPPPLGLLCKEIWVIHST